jgi:hypothetical protein
LALENIARSQKYPCENRLKGCLEFFTIEQIAEHHAVCEYAKIKCPYSLFGYCSWNGFKDKDNFKNHLETKHIADFVKTSTVSSDLSLNATVKFLFCFGELFVYHQQEIDGRTYCTVHLIDTKREASKYRCEFTLRAANGIEQISNTFLVEGYSKYFQTSLDSGKCLCLDKVTVKHFIVYGKKNLNITLSKV